MKSVRFVVAGILIALSAIVAANALPAVQWQPLQGSIGQGSGSRWRASWMDLSSVRDFHRGDRLRVRVQGTAERVLVRLLPKDASSDLPAGLVGSVMRVPPGGVLDVPLAENHPSVKQISVHSGLEAFGQALNSTDGGAAIVSVEMASAN